MITIGSYIVEVPFDMEDDLENLLTDDGIREDLNTLLEENLIEARGFIGDCLGIDLIHVKVNEKICNHNWQFIMCHDEYDVYYCTKCKSRKEMICDFDEEYE